LWAEVFGEDQFGLFAEFSVKEARFVWRWIPPGRFWMGSPEEELGRQDREGPRHLVTISQGFWLGESPVTQAQWKALMGENPSHFNGDERPVEQVSHHDCSSFAAKLSEAVEGLRASLPTEAEWEYACRAGTEGAFHVDGSKCTQPEGLDPVLDALGWFDKNSGGETKTIKLKKPNGWGLYDMHGNVWEWCRDGLRSYSRESVIDPRGPMEDSAPRARRALRGGSWFDRAQHCRAAGRLEDHPGLDWGGTGVRLFAGPELSAAEPLGAERPARWAAEPAAGLGGPGK
jgi:formylglycine-generating enzyme required for sulfatase activity